MVIALTNRSARTGGVYIAVLGTSLIVALLGITAVMAQRIQNRMLTASIDITQARRNADAAVELGLLTIKQDNNWRSQRDAQWFLFTNRGTGSGSSCSVKITDAANDPATEIADRPIKLLGIGNHGPAAGHAPRTAADQRAELVIDPRRRPHDCLKPGNNTPPTWQAIVDYYTNPSHGTPITIANLPNGHPVANFAIGRNPGMEDSPVNGDPPYWVGNAPGTGSADVDRQNVYRSGQYGLRVVRSSQSEGASHSVSHFLKPETPYLVEVWVIEDESGVSNTDLTWSFTLRTKTVGNPAVAVTLIATEGPQSGGWLRLSGTLTSNDWSGELEYAWLTVSCNDFYFGLLQGWKSPDFYMDDFVIKESSTARFIYKQAFGPGVNPFGAPDPNGIYWIDCGNQNLYIERSRIRGTLMVLNPGPNSRVDYGPILWSSNVPGYPALLVSGNFSIRATNQPLSEAGNNVNYNPSGPPAFPHNGSADSDLTDQYASEIHGLVGVSGNLTYKYNPQIRGRVIVGGSTVNNGSPTVTYLPDSLLNPPPPLGGFYTYRYDRRPGSVRKAVQ